MAVAYDTAASAEADSTDPLSIPVTIAAGSDIAAIYFCWNKSTVTAVGTPTFGGVNGVLVAGPGDVEGGEDVRLYSFVLGTTSGAQTLSHSRTGSGPFLGGLIVMNGVDQTTPANGLVTFGPSVGTTCTFGTITSAAGNLVVSGIGEDDDDSGSSWSVSGSGQTIRVNRAYGFQSIGMSSQTGASSIADHSYTHGNRAALGYAVNVIAAGGGGNRAPIIYEFAVGS